MRGEEAVDIDRTSLVGKIDVLRFGDRLVAKEDHAVLGKGCAHLRQFLLRQGPGEVHAQDLRADTAMVADFDRHLALS